MDGFHRQMSETGLSPPHIRRRSSRSLTPYIVLTSVIAVLFYGLGCLSIYLAYPHLNRNSFSADRDQKAVCLPCKDAGLTLPDTSHRGWSDRGRYSPETLCCFNQGNDPQPYTSYFSQDARTSESGKLCGQSSSGTPSAHLFLDWPKLKENQLQWNVTTPLSDHTGHLSPTLIYRPKYGGLEVTHSGVYTIYNQITFRQMPGNSTATLFVHCLYRERATPSSEPHVVVCSRTTKMNVTSARLMQPSYLQATILLNLGDIVFVNVSAISEVFGSYTDSYFGMSEV